MEEERIVKPLEFLFYEDIRKNNSPSHITDLMVITIKSIMPSEDYVAVNIDYHRYNEEIKLWKYYRHGENSSLLNILGDISPKLYWNHIDDTVYPRMLPIVLTNKEYLTIKKEVIKNVLFSTGNIKTLIEAILLSKLLYLLIMKEENIIDKLKEEIINLSQVEFVEEYRNCFRIPIEEYEGSFKIKFEQNKIYALNILNQSYSKDFRTLQDALEVYLNAQSGETSIGKCVNIYMNGLFDSHFEIDDYYKELGLYLYRLRKGRINPEALKIEKYYLPDVFQFNEGEIFYHSLLNKSKVIKKEVINDKMIIYINTKSGIYKFIR